MTYKNFPGITPPLADLNERSQQIFRQIVEAYCDTGAPVGSKTLSHRLDTALSPATIRNVMADLERLGLLYAPHTSAGRLPTETGLRFFVHGLLEQGNILGKDNDHLSQVAQSRGQSFDQVLEEAIQRLSELSQCAGLVFAPKTEAPLKQVEFVRLSDGQALVVLVTEGGLVENRVVEIPKKLPNTALIAASNYLTAELAGKSLSEVKRLISKEIKTYQAELDDLSAAVVENGLGVISGAPSQGGTLIVKGQSHLLNEAAIRGDIDQLRRLFNVLEEKETIMSLVDSVTHGEGIQIFIGAENEFFNLTGSSLIISTYQDEGGSVVGAIGVIGPSHINYGRIIPMVDYTSRLISKLLGDKK
ncbi:heat-inducible transcriptional repressor HrcA [Alphaproteobacteria bacterium]|nr:heat-inducible transcriptional repressor HrcA [Alphaproteobacteria bacterium]